MRITLQRKREKDQRETTQTPRGITKIYCVNTVSVTETNIIEVNRWLTVRTLSVTAVTLNQGDISGFFPPVSVKAPATSHPLRKVKSNGGDVTARTGKLRLELMQPNRSASGDTV